MAAPRARSIVTAPIAASPILTKVAGVPARSNALPLLPPMGKLVPRGARTRALHTAAPGARRGVNVFGDSLTLSTWNYVQRIARDRHQPFDGGSFGGTALCDWLPSIKRSLTADRPAFLVLAFVGNNLTPCTLGADHLRQVGAPLVAKYRHDAYRAIVAARATHTRVFLIGAPEMENRVWNADATGLRTAMRGLAAHNPNVVYIDAARVISPDGFQRRRPCLPFETGALGCHGGKIVVRASDGVHLSPPLGGDGGYSSGAWRYANVLLRDVPNAS